jgi:CBS domain containing-hemolysin-like protein
VTALRLIAVFLLVGCNAFFAAVEFSLVAVRPSRIRQLVEEGSARARLVQGLLGEMGRVVSGVQVGITLASLGLGFLGEVTIAAIVEGIFAGLGAPPLALVVHGLSLGIAFLSLSFLHVVFGELVPKTISLERAERVSLAVAGPFSIFLRAFRPAIRVLEGSAVRINAALGVARAQRHTLAHTAEELQILVQQAREGGIFEPGEEKFIQSAIELGDVQVREIMVPRPDLHALPLTASLDDVLKTFAVTQRSRLPVYQATLDHVVGFIHIKDFLWMLMDRQRRAEDGLPVPSFHLRALLRPVVIVPETKSAGELLRELRSKHAGLAMVVDEFGTILGLVTMEDLLEQVVGEIYDEFDVVEKPLTLADGAMVVDGAVKVRDLETQYNIDLPEDPSYETVGGFVMTRLGYIPRGGEAFDEAGFRFTVMEMDRRRVARVKIQKLQVPEVPAEAATGGA